MKGKVILFITALVAIGLTIATYDLVVNEWTAMIKLSLGVVCIAELAIISTLGLLPTLNFKNGATGILVNVYAILMIAWSLIGCRYEGNTYPIGLLLISILMLIIIGISVMGSHEADRLNDETERDIQNKRCFTSAIGNQNNLSTMWLTIQATVEDSDTKKRLRLLIERIQALPSNCFPDAVIEKSMNDIVAMCGALSNEEAYERIIKRMNIKITELSNYLKTI